MLEKSCKDFIDVLASKSPVPGGGGACAYVGALGMALGNMVGNLTVGKKKYKDVEEDVKTILEEGEELIKKLEILVQEDADVFYPLSKAYSLPKDTDEEIKYKEKVMEEVLEKASLVPLKVAKTCCRAIELHEELAKKGTKIAISDVAVGVLFCKSALEASRLNVYINTNMMKNKNIKSDLENQIDDLVLEYSKRAADVKDYVESLIKGGK